MHQTLICHCHTDVTIPTIGSILTNSYAVPKPAHGPYSLACDTSCYSTGCYGKSSAVSPSSLPNIATLFIEWAGVLSILQWPPWEYYRTF